MLTNKHGHGALNETVTLDQVISLLETFINYHRITALGPWDEQPASGVIVNHYSCVILSQNWIHLLVETLPHTMLSHLDLNLKFYPGVNDLLNRLSITLPISNITHLRICLSKAKLEILCPAFRKSKLQLLSIYDTEFSTEDCDALVKALPLCKHLNTLRIYGCSLLTSKHLKLLEKFILAVTQSSIKYIYLSNGFDYASLEIILNMFVENIPGSNIEGLTIEHRMVREGRSSKSYLSKNALYDKLIPPALAKNVELRIQSLSKKLMQVHILEGSSGLPSAAPLTFSQQASPPMYGKENDRKMGIVLPLDLAQNSEKYGVKCRIL